MRAELCGQSLVLGQDAATREHVRLILLKAQQVAGPITIVNLPLYSRGLGVSGASAWDWDPMLGKHQSTGGGCNNNLRVASLYYISNTL